MPQPTPQDVHPVDVLLTNYSLAYMQAQNAFIATLVFPVLPVEKQSNKYATYTKNDWFRDEAKKRAGSAESAGSGYTLSSDSYNCDVFAIHKDIDYQTRANADPQFDLDRDATEFVTRRMLLKQEIQWAADFFAASIWGTDSTPANLWSDYTASDPGDDVDAGKEAILKVTGQDPNTLVIGYQVYRKLRRHPDVKAHFGLPLGSARMVNEEMLAQFFDVDRVLVARAIKATNVEGETAAYDFVQGKHALLCHVAPSVGPLTPTAGLTFAWSGVSAGLGAGVGISSIDLRPSGRKVDRIEAEAAWDNKVVASDLGYFFNGAVA